MFAQKGEVKELVEVSLELWEDLAVAEELAVLEVQGFHVSRKKFRRDRSFSSSGTSVGFEPRYWLLIRVTGEVDGGRSHRV